MKCPKCNKKIDSDSQYCHYCGKKLESKTEVLPQESKTSNRNYVLIVVLAIVLVIVGLGLMILLTVIGFRSYKTESSSSSQTIETEKYPYTEPVLNREYKKANSVNTTGFANNITVDSVKNLLLEIGFSEIITTNDNDSDDCSTVVVATNNVYNYTDQNNKNTNFHQDDNVKICFNRNNQIQEVEMSMIYLENDFNEDDAFEQMSSLGSNFYQLEMNKRYLSIAHKELKQEMQYNEMVPSGDADEQIGLYEIGYDLEYERESRTNPAFYTFELSISLED